MNTCTLVRKVKRFLRRRHLHDAGLVVAVSGGPDSVALLRALLAARPAKAGPLVVAHLNHQLRGEESEADEAFVRQLCAALAAEGAARVAFRCERLDVGRFAGQVRQNLENLARRVRYRWLTDVARDTGIRYIATGHTADDQAETMVHRLLRGTGLRGLRGIAEQRTLAMGIELVRPLLRATRAEVLAYLEGIGQAYRQDRSNADLNRTRNRIRHELLPHLARYNPAIGAVLCRLADQAAAVYGHIEVKARALLAEAERPRAGPTLVFDRQRLAAAPPHLVRETLRLAWLRENWPLGGMGFVHWDRLANLVSGETSTLDLPGGIHARRCRGVVQVGRKP